MKKASLLIASTLLGISAYAECDSTIKAGSLEFPEWMLIYMPIVLFVFFILYFSSWLKKSNFQLGDALSEQLIVSSNQNSNKNTQNDEPDGKKTTIDEIKQPELARSSSRLIAFISSFISVMIGTCLITFYMYFALTRCKKEIPDFQELWPIMASLGIGTIPYATRVLSQNK